MAQTGSVTLVRTGPATAGRTKTAPDVVTAAARSAPPVQASAEAAGFPASRPPHQWPTENPASTTAITAVQV
jgi:hypothetical protein